MEMAEKPLIEGNYLYPTPYSNNTNNYSNQPISQPLINQNNNPQLVQPLYQAQPALINQNNNLGYQAPEISPPSNYQNPQIISQNLNQPIQFINFANITNVDQVHHLGIHQIGSDTIYFSFGCCSKIMPIIFFICGLLCAFSAFGNGFGLYFAIGVGVIFLIVSICMGCKWFYSVYFYLGPNTLTMSWKTLIRRSTRIFYPGQITSLELKSFKGKKKNDYFYDLIVYNNRGKETVFSEQSSGAIFTKEEMDYFNYVLNNHIQTKMRVQI